MTQNRRIALNVMATYGRSLLALFCGIFTSRWALQALGVKAYGVYAVTGVIITMMSLINGLFSVSVSRFFAVAVGKVKACGAGEDALEECRRWFSVAVLIHLALPIGLIIMGAPIGFWAIENYFVIPPEYLSTAYWVLGFAIITAFISMASVPFNAMFTARQEIAEMTLYSIISTVARFILTYILLSYNGNRLWFHAFCCMLISFIPSFLVVLRAFKVFPECVLRRKYMFDLKRVKALFSFTGWLCIGSVSMTTQVQGMVTVVNKFLGIEFNSSMNIADAVVGNSTALSNSLTGAFSPAIQNAAGAGDRKAYEKFAVNACKFGTLLCALFVCPLCLETDYVIGIWLVNPPPMVASLASLLLISMLIDRTCSGLISAIHAHGRIMLHEVMNSVVWIAGLAIGWHLIAHCGMSILVVAWVRMLIIVILIVQRVFLWKFQLGFAVRPWLFGFLVPSVFAIVASMGVGYLLRCKMNPSFIRLVVCTVAQVLVMSVLSYRFVLSYEDRAFVRMRLLALAARMKGAR